MRGRGGAGSPRLLGVLLSAMTVCTLMQFVLAVLAPYIIGEFALSRTRYGSAASVLFLAAVVVSLLAGRLVERWGEIALLRGLYLAAVGAFVTLAVTPGWPGVLLAALVMGFPLGVGNPVTNTLVVTRVPATGQGAATGLKQAGVQVGALFVGLVLPPVATAYGWRTAAGLLAVVAAAGLVAALPLRDVPAETGTRRTAPPAPPDGVPWETAGRAEPDPGGSRHGPGIGLLTGYAVLMGVGTSAVNAFLPLFAYEELAMPAERAGWIVALLGLLGAVARVSVGVLGTRLPVLELWLAGLALAGALAVALVFPAAQRPVLVWAAVVGYGATAPAWQSAAMLALVREPGPAARSSGRVIGGFLLGMVAGPLAFGWLTDRTAGYAAGWWLVIVVLAAAGVVAATAAGRRVRR